MDWRCVAGYEGMYEVSDTGVVRSLNRLVACRGGYRTSPGKKLKPCVDKDGYLHVRLCSKGKARTMRVHRIVAKAFLKGTEQAEVNHKDFNKQNNKVINLEWATRQSNEDHANAAGVRNPFINPAIRRKLTPENVVAIRQRYRNGETQVALGKIFKVHFTAIGYIVRNEVWCA